MNLREAAQKAVGVMANARDFLGEGHYKDETEVWNAEQQSDELQDALLALHAALAEPVQLLTQQQIDKIIFDTQITMKNYCDDEVQTDFARRIEAAIRSRT